MAPQAAASPVVAVEELPPLLVVPVEVSEVPVVTPVDPVVPDVELVEVDDPEADVESSVSVSVSVSVAAVSGPQAAKDVRASKHNEGQANPRIRVDGAAA